MRRDPFTNAELPPKWYERHPGLGLGGIIVAGFVMVFLIAILVSGTAEVFGFELGSSDVSSCDRDVTLCASNADY